MEVDCSVGFIPYPCILTVSSPSSCCTSIHVAWCTNSHLVVLRLPSMCSTPHLVLISRCDPCCLFFLLPSLRCLVFTYLGYPIVHIYTRKCDRLKPILAESSGPVNFSNWELESVEFAVIQGGCFSSLLRALNICVESFDQYFTVSYSRSECEVREVPSLQGGR
jgi:hypothetical protein